MIFVCPTCHGRFGGPHTHVHLSRTLQDLTRHDPRFSSCRVCKGYGRLETCDTCEGLGRVEKLEDGSLVPARDVAQMLNEQAMRPWEGAPGQKLRRPK